MHLPCQYLFSDFSPSFANVRPPTIHAFVGDNPYCEVVSCHTMVLSAHDLRSHVTRCARGFSCVVWSPVSGNAKISQTQISITVEDQVFRLDVPMNDPTLMDNLQGLDKASNEELCFLLNKFPFSSNVVSEISTK